MNLTHKGTVKIETERLILRRFNKGDAQEMFDNWASNPKVCEYLMWSPHPDLSETEKTLDFWVSSYEKPDFYQWAIELKEIGRPIGSIGAVKQKDETKMVHIGYCIGEKWWNKGYTSEALAALIKFFFDEVGINRIESRHDSKNPNSGKVMTKCGLKYEGTMRRSDWNQQGLCDSMWYAILAEDYFG